MTTSEWLLVALGFAGVGIVILAVITFRKPGMDWRVTVGLIAAGIAAILGAVLGLRRAGKHPAHPWNDSALDPVVTTAPVVKAAHEATEARYEEERHAIDEAATDPDVGPSLADLANADAAKRRKR